MKNHCILYVDKFKTNDGRVKFCLDKCRTKYPKYIIDKCINFIYEKNT